MGAFFTDGEFVEPLAVRKQGLGDLKLTNALNDFTGGLFLEAGTLTLSTQSASSGIVAAIGLGDFVVYGGTANTTVKVPAKATDFPEDFAVTLIGTGTQIASAAKAYFTKEKLTDAETTLVIPQVFVLGTFNEPDSETAFELSNTVNLKVLNIQVAGAFLKSGTASLTIGDGGESGLSQLGSIVLKEGTLVLADDSYLDATLLVSGSASAKRKLAVTMDTLLRDSEPLTSRVWSAGFTFAGGGNTLTLADMGGGAAGISIQNGITLTVDDGTLSLGNLQKVSSADSASFSKAGLGTLVFAGDSISSGTLRLDTVSLLAGTVRFSGGSPLAPMVLSSALVTGTATGVPLLDVDPNKSVSVSGTVSGTGFIKTGTGALAFTGANTLSGTTTLRSGTLSLAAGTGAILLGDSETLASAPPTLVSTGTVSGAISVGSGATSAYTATLASSGTGTGTFSGAITVGTGSASLALQAATGGTLNLSGPWTANAKPIIVGGSGKAGTVLLSSTLSTTGGVSVVSGSLQAGVLNALGSNTPVNLNGGSFNLGTFNTTAGAVTLTSGSIYGSGSLNAASITAQSGSIYAALAGNGSFTKSGAGKVTVANASGFSGTTTVSEGVLTSGLPASSTTINIASAATYTLALTASGTYNGSFTNHGTTLLTSTAPVVLTLGNAARLTGTGLLQIGNNVTLMPASGAQDGIFATGFTLTLNGGSYSANGTTQTISNVVFGGSGGSLLGTGSIKTNTVPTASASNIFISPNLTFPVSRKTNQVEGAALVNQLEFYLGALGDLASTGSYTQIVVASENTGAVLSFDRLVRASTSVTARLSAGSVSSTGYTLSVGAVVETPFLDIQKGVTALFATGGSLSGGTLNIGGTVSLSPTAGTFSFSSIQLNDGSLTEGRLSAGSILDQGTGSSSLSAILAGSATVTKTGSGILTISGTNTSYTGALSVAAGTVVLGGTSALGTAARLASLAAGTTLRLGGNSIKIAAIAGGGTIENTAFQAATLTLETAADSTFDGVLRDGTGTGVISLVKNGATTVTLTNASLYTGSTILKQGRLALAGNGALPSTTALTIEDGTFSLGDKTQAVSAFTQTGGLVESGTVTLGSGSFALSGGSVNATLAGAAGATLAGTVNLNAAATYTGATVLNSGKLTLASNGSLPSGTALTLQTGTFDLGGKTQTVASFTQNGGALESGVLTLQAGSFALNNGSVSTTLAGAAGATIGGNVTLNTAATYTGATVLNSGKLTLASNGALSAQTALTLQGGTLALGGKNQAVTSFTQTSGSVEAGTVTLQTGFFALNGGSVNATLAGGAGATVAGNVTLNTAAIYTGATVLNSGKLTLASIGALSSQTALTVQGGTFALGGNNQTVASFTQNGGSVEAGTVTLQNGNFALNDASVNATLAGGAGATLAGTVNLNAAATYTGATVLNSGKLTLASNGSLPSGTALTVQDGTLDLGGKTQAVGAVVVNAGRIDSGTLSGSGYTLNGGTIGASLKGTGALAVNGIVTLSGANTYSGVTSLGSSSAQLTVGGANALAGSVLDYNNGTVLFGNTVNSASFAGLTGSKDLALDKVGGGSVALTVTNAVDATYSGALTGTGSFTKAGAGNLTLSKTPTYSGVTTVSAGSLTLGTAGLLSQSRAIINNDGTINLTLSGDLTYSGTLGGNGTINLTSDAPVTLTLAPNAKLGGTIVLKNVQLDLSAANELLASGSTLQIGSGASLKLGTTTQEITNLIIPTNPGAQGRLLGSGTVYYSSLDPANLLNSAGTNPQDGTYADMAIKFEVLSKTSPILTNGTQTGLLVTAGRAGTDANGRQLLLLQPESTITRVIIDKPLVLSTGIVATTGTVNGVSLAKGMVSIENTLTLTTGSIRFGSGIEATLTQAGSLVADAVDNSGLFIVDVSGNKTVDIPIRGSGSLRKAGVGIATLSRSNSYAGSTTVAAGILELGTAAALGTSGAVQFAGGTLRYGSGVANDLSPRIAAIASGTTAGIDTGDNNVTFATGLTGAGGIAKLGAGTLVLTGSNSFSGDASVKAGTLQVGAGATTGSLAAAAAVDSGAFLRFLRVNDLTYSGALSGTGTVEQAGTGALKFDGTNAGFAGTLVLSSGTVGLASDNASGTASIRFNGGTLRYESGVVTDVSARISELASGRSANIDTGVNNVSFASGLTGAGGLNKLGAGTLELQATNGFQGPTTVLAGVLRAGTALSSTSSIRVSGGSLEISSYRSGAELAVDVNGTVTVPADLGAFSFGTIVNQGRLSFTGGTADITVSNLSGNGQAYFAADATLLGGISAGSINVAGDLVAPTISGGSVSAARLYQVDGGSAVIGVNVSGGRIVVQGTIASELGIVSGGSLVFFAPVNVASLAGGNLDAQASANLASVSGGTAKLSGSHMAIGTVSGGSLSLAAGTASISILNGGTLINQGILAVRSGSSNGSISGAGSLVKEGSLSLTLEGATSYAGETKVTGGTLVVRGVATLASSQELIVSEQAQARFEASTGTITLKALSGTGRSFFGSNAVILGGSISSGEVEAAGRLTANVSGGSVTAATLTAGTVSGGNVSLTNGASSATLLTDGSINLAGTASLAVSTGTFAGSLTGTGTLIKTGAGSLNLSAPPPTQIAVNVQGGTLNVDALLTGTRSVAVAAGSLLNTTATTGTFSGRLSGAGTTAITGTGTLTLGSTGFLQGRLTLGTGLTLDISQHATTNVVDAATSITLLGSSQLTLGSRQVELQDLVLSQDALLNADGAVILYDSTPLMRLSDGSTAAIINQSNGIVAGSLVSGSLRFEENSKQVATGVPGTYRFIAGRVKDLPTDVGAVTRLLLDPQEGKTVRISSAIPKISQAIVATGTGAGGFVSVGTLVDTPSFVIGSGIRATFTEAGSLAAGGVFSNSGTLQFSVLSGTKPVANLISGSGTLEKIDPGVLVLSGANTYSGVTRLSGGVLQLDNSAALGTGTILFNGGGLKYGAGISNDLSSRFAAIGAGVTAAVDTGTNNVTFASVLSGTGGMSKSGNGTLVLAAANTFAGALEVTAGTVKVGNVTAGSLNASLANVSSGALLSFERNDAAVFAGSLTGAGRVVQAGAGVLTLTGNGSEFDGTFELRNGITVLGGRNALAGGSVSFGGGTLRYGTDTFEDLSDRIRPLTTTALVDTGAYTVTYQTGLTGEAGLTKYGVGSLIFANQNGYSGTTTVAAGTLRYMGAGLASGGTIHTLAGTVVELQNNDSTALPFNGLISGAARLQKTGTGTITISGTQTNTGGVTLAAGSLVLNNSATLGGVVTLDSGSTLDLLSGSLNPNATLAFGGGKLRIGDSELIVNSLNFGSGEILFAGTAESTTLYYSQQTGTTLVTGTTASLDSGVLVPEQVTLLKYTKNADGSAAGLSGPLKGTIRNLPSTSDLTVTPSGKRLTLAVEGGLNLTSFTGENGVDLAITKPVTLSGDFRLKGGSLALTGTLKSTGGSVVFGAVTEGTSTAVTGTIGAGGSVVARELTLTGKSALTLENPDGVKEVQVLQVGALSTGTNDDRKNDAKLIIGGAGTLSLGQGETRQTLKGSGSIQGNVALGSNAVLSPGNSPGTLFVVGSLNLTSGTVRIEVGGLGSGTLTQDRISTSGSLVIGGTASGERPTFQIVDTDGILSNGGSLGTLFVSGTTTVAVVPTIVNQGTFTFARQSSSGAVLPSVMYTLQSGTTDLNALKIDRLRFASFAGSAPNVVGFATALDTRILTQRATSDGLLELGTGIANTAAVPAQLAAALPVAYAEMAALSTQRTLNLHQGLVGHFSSVRANLTDAPDGAFSAWTTGYGAGHKQDGNPSFGTAGFTASTWGEMFGVEQRIGGFLLGVTGATGRTSATFSNHPGRATTDSWHGGLYGALDMDGFILESGAMLGATDTRARRTISAAGLTTREGRVTLSGSEWTANLGLAKPIVASDALTLTPSIRVIAQGQSQNAAAESDLSGLEVSLAKQRTTTLQHQAGMEIRRKLTLAGRPAAASLQLDWIHNYNAKGRNLNMALSGDPSASYAYKGSDAGADSIHIGGAFDTALSERVTLRLGGEYQSQTGLSTVRGSVSLGYQF
jgi:autotransporter-associated beta strand protein